jgi:hypothetical protein
MKREAPTPGSVFVETSLMRMGFSRATKRVMKWSRHSVVFGRIYMYALDAAE